MPGSIEGCSGRIFQALNITSDLAVVRPRNAVGAQATSSLGFCTRFKSTCVRDSVLGAKWAFGQLRLRQIIPGSGDLMELYEMLSPYVHKQGLAAKARANAANCKYVWTRGDKVLLCRTDDSEVTSIIFNSDLKRYSDDRVHRTSAPLGLLYILILVSILAL